MKFITQKKEFEHFLNITKNYIKFTNTFPQQVFIKGKDAFSFITFDYVRSSRFFMNLCSFCKIIGEESFKYMVADPGPEDYFYKSKVEKPIIERYKTLTCSVEDSAADFLEALNSYSGGPQPDNMMDVSDVIVVSSINQKWHIVTERERDIGVCVFYDSDIHKKFMECYGEDLLDDAQSAAEYTYGETKWGRKADYKKIDEFIKNYPDNKSRQCKLNDFEGFS